ncbi:LysR family transcriptional regulator [Achromobacter animicus]|uniref:LysR family transcriptional regulator n=1 Tax=Achromobacter animicus TaxID=1389935 RepID=UPI0028B12202|nr:LysR family transcriptional regulator [Achromobacter animicus]
MTTFRELEAFVAVVDMGSFEKAAQSLGTSQSAVSRLINEFEQTFKHPLFSREHRAAQLTVQGQEVLRQAKAILRGRANLMDRFVSPTLLEPVLRLGVTELAAVTWLGHFIGEMKSLYPKLRVDLRVDSSPGLYGQMRDGKLDVAVVLDSTRSTNMARIPVGQVEFGWFCSTNVPLSGTLKLSLFEQQTLLLQGSTGGTGNRVESWLTEQGIKPANIIQTDSLAALAGLCVAGLGIASLPRVIVRDAMNASLVRQLKIPLGAPVMKYILLVRIDAISDFHRTVADTAAACCDFEKPMIAQPYH